MLRQLLAITVMNFANLRHRIGSSVVVVVGVAGVVAVLLGLLAMSSGFRRTLTDTAREDRALVVRGASNNEISGWLGADEVAAIAGTEGIAIASGEIYATLAVTKRASGVATDVVGRGVGADAFALRPELSIVRGRRFEPGKAEVIVGVDAYAQYVGLDVGDRLDARNMTFTVVGHFAAASTAVESEIWMDSVIAQSVYRRAAGASVVRIKLGPGATADAVRARLDDDPRVTVTLIPEVEFYAAQSAARAALIDAFAYAIAAIMAIGAIAAALNTMYTAVSRRTYEIGTLRAMGFDSVAIVASVLGEALLLAGCGGLIGAAAVYLMLDGVTTSTFNNAADSQVAFAFLLTPRLIATGVVAAVVIGALGGLLPALRAARMSIARALRP